MKRFTNKLASALRVPSSSFFRSLIISAIDILAPCSRLTSFKSCSSYADFVYGFHKITEVSLNLSVETEKKLNRGVKPNCFAKNVAVYASLLFSHVKLENRILLVLSIDKFHVCHGGTLPLLPRAANSSCHVRMRIEEGPQ